MYLTETWTVGKPTPRELRKLERGRPATTTTRTDFAFGALFACVGTLFWILGSPLMEFVPVFITFAIMVPVSGWLARRHAKQFEALNEKYPRFSPERANQWGGGDRYVNPLTLVNELAKDATLLKRHKLSVDAFVLDSSVTKLFALLANRNPLPSAAASEAIKTELDRRASAFIAVLRLRDEPYRDQQKRAEAEVISNREQLEVYEDPVEASERAQFDLLVQDAIRDSQETT